MGRRRWRVEEDAAAAALHARCAALLQQTSAAERRVRALLLRLRALADARLAARGTRKASFAAAAQPPSVDPQPLEQCADVLQLVVDGYREVASAATEAAAAAAVSAGASKVGGGGGARGGEEAAAATPGAAEASSGADASASSESHASGKRSSAGAPSAVSAVVFRYKTSHWLRLLRRARLSLTVLAGHAAAAALAYCARAADADGCPEALVATLRLAGLHNALLALAPQSGQRAAAACRNTCPALQRPLRRLSMARLLQLAAQARAEAATRALLAALLRGFHGDGCCGAQGGGPAPPSPAHSPAPSPERPRSSSAEVHRTLTRHLTPPCATVLPPVEGAGGQGTTAAPTAASAVARLDPSALPRLVRAEDEQAVTLALAAARGCPQLLGAGAVAAASAAPAGEGRSGRPLRVTRAARERARAFYAAALWAAVGARAEHELLWWSAAPLGPASHESAAQLRRWIHQLLVAGAVPAPVAPALETLQDALCCHVTATSWDALFRPALVHSRPAQPIRPLAVRPAAPPPSAPSAPAVAPASAPAAAPATAPSAAAAPTAVAPATAPPAPLSLPTEVLIPQCGTQVGQLFMEVLRSLTALSNACETTAAWTAGAPLDQLPLVEQIPVLHRLDHSVHSVRLWAAAAARAEASAWRVGAFTLVSQWDVGACVAAISAIRLADHHDMRAARSEHVVVCARMRAKLVSEVRDNIEKLQKVPEECLEGMAAVCRTVSLANLHMVFPEPSYYRQTREMPSFASGYVHQYLERVLRPVLTAVAPLPPAAQETIGAMVVRIMCEAWLDHIYMHRIKFSERGALQLLLDFAAVAEWLCERAALAPALRRALAASEALRRCEGVGRLLLRRRGERIPTTAPPAPAPPAPPYAANVVNLRPAGRRAPTAPARSPSRSPSPPADEDGGVLPAEMYVPNQEQWLELRAPRGRRLCAASLCCS